MLTPVARERETCRDRGAVVKSNPIARAERTTTYGGGHSKRMINRLSKTLTIGLYFNAAALLLIGLALLARSNIPEFLPAALAQQAPQPIAGGGGLFLMPGQLSATTWGCYVMDVDRQTLMVYQYQPGERMLRLMAARDFSNDRRLRRYNTEPPPDEIKALTDKEQDKSRQGQ